MEEQKYYFEIASAQSERTIRRLWILCILQLAVIITIFSLWMYERSQWELVETTETVETDAGDGGNAVGIIGDNNGVNYGEGEGH